MDIDLTNSLTPATNYIYDNIKVNPFIILIVAIVIIFYFFVFKYLGRNATVTTLPSRPSKGITFLEIIMWGVLIFLVLTNSLKYFFGLDINVTIKNLFTSIPEIDINVEQELEDIVKKPPIPEIERIKQVFHIPANKYTYDDAKAVCKAYDAELATYNQVANAYKNNAEWCSYGWSKNQLALYPTQEETYNKLQKIKGHEHDCGRPGINGGFISNSNARFGVNCYGHKPIITHEEEQMMINRSPYPITKQDKLLEKRVKCYRNKLKNIIVSPFNNNKWSKA